MGAVSFEQTGETIPIVAWEHDLEFDHDTRLLQQARFRFTDATGKVWEIEAEPKLRLFLHGGGYTSGEDRRGFLPVELWTERWDLTDRALLPRHRRPQRPDLADALRRPRRARHRRDADRRARALSCRAPVRAR